MTKFGRTIISTSVRYGEMRRVAFTLNGETTIMVGLDLKRMLPCYFRQDFASLGFANGMPYLPSNHGFWAFHVANGLRVQTVSNART